MFQLWRADYYASHDRIFTTKLGSPQSLMIQEGTHNLNVTLKGFRGLFGQNTTNHTISSPKGGLSLTLMVHGQTCNPKCKPKWLPNETLSFSWDGSTHSTHNTAKVSDWLIFQNQASSVVMLTSISQSLYDFSQKDFYHVYSSHI